MPARRWVVPLVILVAFSAAGLTHFAYFWLDDLARRHSDTALPRLIEEMTGAYAAALVFLLVMLLVNRWPIRRHNWRSLVVPYLGAVIGLGVLHTSLMWGSRALLYPMVGLGPYDYGLMRFRFPMEFAVQAPNIGFMIAGLHGWRFYREARARELHAAQLEGELNRAQLDRLEAQLQPHFLFNTLNAISSLMYSDPALADRMMGRLSDLLRLTFQHAPDAEVTLASELEWLGWYLDIMQLRFGDRLSVERNIAPDTLKLAVPRLALQPLVENALTHGAAKHAGPATVRIDAHRDGDRLLLSVSDDGPGLASEPATALGSGIGLSNTTARLRVLYGEQGRLTLARPPAGGLQVTLDLPARPL